MCWAGWGGWGACLGKALLEVGVLALLLPAMLIVQVKHTSWNPPSLDLVAKITVPGEGASSIEVLSGGHKLTCMPYGLFVGFS